MIPVPGRYLAEFRRRRDSRYRARNDVFSIWKCMIPFPGRYLVRLRLRRGPRNRPRSGAFLI